MNTPRITTDPTLPLPGWARTNRPVFLRKYIGGTLVTMGEYPTARSAMFASDEAVWIQLGSNGWRSQDGRTIIEEPRT